MAQSIQNIAWLNAIQSPIMVIDRRGIVVAFNRTAEAQSGLYGDELIGRPIWDTPLDPEPDLTPAFPLDSVASMITSFFTIGYENTHITWSIRSVIGDDGVPQWMCTGIAVDNHDPPYRQMFEHNPAVMLLIDPNNGRIIDANRAATRYYGYPVDELVHMKLHEITNNPDANMLMELQRGIEYGQEFLVFQHHTADGHALDVEVFPSYVSVANKQLLYCVIVDVTDRNLIENALRNSELQYRQLVELMQEGLAVHDIDNVNTYVNDKLTEMLGYSRDEMLDRPITKFMDEENQAITLREMDKREKGESSKYEIAFIHKEGYPVYTLVASTPIIDDDGTVTGSFGVITDITERKIAEESLRQSNEELDAFAHTVAHDLKSPISVMMGFANVLETEFVHMSDNELKDYLHSMARTSDKMITIIDELLLLSEMRNIEEVDVRAVDMAGVLNEALQRVEFMREQYGASIDVPDPDTWIPALAHAQWIEEVWVNYLTNAIKYGGQPPYVQLGCEEEGDFVRFWVKDNGRGIPADKLDEVFMPFTRLEQVRVKGHGLGLSIVQRIVHKLGGEVHVESTPGKGTIFSFTLPIVP